MFRVTGVVFLMVIAVVLGAVTKPNNTKNITKEAKEKQLQQLTYLTNLNKFSADFYKVSTRYYFALIIR